MAQFSPGLPQPHDNSLVKERGLGFMRAEEFDRKFDEGESILEYLDLSQIQRGNGNDTDEDVIALAFPSSLVLALKAESQRLNLPLQVMLRKWIEERLSASV